MLDCIRSCLRALRQGVRRKCKGIRKKQLSSGFDLWTSSFASMEVSNQLKQVFKFIDANGDGKITPHELSQVLSCLGYKKSRAEREAEAMVKEMDCNGDGFIDVDEFIDAVKGSDGQLGGCEEEDEEECLMDAFLIFDLDKNGLISAMELQNVLIGLGSDKCSLRDCKLMIKGVDKDGDGFVDFDEFRLMMTSMCKLEQRQENIEYLRAH